MRWHREPRVFPSVGPLPITNDGNGNSNQGKIATIESFTAEIQGVPLGNLASGTIRVPVT